MNEAAKDKKTRITQESTMLTALCLSCGVITNCLPNPHSSHIAMITNLCGMGFVVFCLGWAAWRTVRLVKELKAL